MPIIVLSAKAGLVRTALVRTALVKAALIKAGLARARERTASACASALLTRTVATLIVRGPI